MSDFDIVVDGGLWFDGTGSAPRRRNLGIRDGVVVRASAEPLPVGPDTEVIDAAGKWVVPGFVDVHTHYDAEVLVSPGLPESVRHGVTTVVLGNCSLSTVYSTPRECADLFSRVEAVPHDSVLRILDDNKSWQNPAEYVDALESLPLGPNVAGFIGHSDIRTRVLGLAAAPTGG
jgi:N-acyl-D-aspartate/D-glutamate deacylase